MWRPEGWENPYIDPSTKPEGSFITTFHHIYEAGADAMLEALKNKSPILTSEQMKLIAPDRKFRYGWLVFIPDDKK